MYGSEDKIQKV